jgi:hypothetical protein
MALNLRDYYVAIKNETNSWVVVDHTCNPRYLGGWDWENHGLMPTQANSSWDSYLQNNQSKMDWRYGSNGRVPALQVPAYKCKVQKKKDKWTLRT